MTLAAMATTAAGEVQMLVLQALVAAVVGRAMQ